MLKYIYSLCYNNKEMTRRGGIDMPISVPVKGNGVDAALKRFKNKVAKSGLLGEVKRKKDYQESLRAKKISQKRIY